LEIVARAPLTVLDGAHNPAAAKALSNYLRAFRRSNSGSRVILVLAMMRDKDHLGFVEPFKGLVDEVVLTQADLKRSSTTAELLSIVAGAWPRARTNPLVPGALDEARRLARQEDAICVTGSLMLVGEVKAWLRGCRLSPLRG
jgi:dihydrofolate synthase/folylpolyglutamate synthase